MTHLRDRLALMCILAARRLTTWGWTDDHLEQAELRLRAQLRTCPECLSRWRARLGASPADVARRFEGQE